MQTNTPTPAPQRNRRAGRMSPPSPEQSAASAIPAQGAALAPQAHAAPQTSYAAPVSHAAAHHFDATSAPRPNSGDALQPLHSAAPRPVPRPTATPAGRAVPIQTGGPGFTAVPTPPGERPVPLRTGHAEYTPAPTRTPAGDRPQAVGRPVTTRRDDPRERRANTQRSAQQQRRAVPVYEAEHQKRRSIPGWLSTTLTLAFIGVLALATLMLVVMAQIKTVNDERQAAWEALLSSHHVTTREDSTRRVTYQDTIEYYAAQYNLNPAFVTAVIRQESSFRTNAESSVGARGLMQMMPDTARDVAGKLDEAYDFDRLFDAETSIRYGCWYLNFLAERYGGDTVLVVAAYHAGLGNVDNWLDDRDISPDGVTIPIQNIPITNTRIYAERVTYSYGIYEMLLYPASDAADVPAALRAPVRLFASDR